MRTGADTAAWLLALGLAPKTASEYARNIYAAMLWLQERGETLETVPAEMMVAYVATRPLTHSSRVILRAALRHYWEHVEREDPPLRAIRVPPEPRHGCRALEEDDARILAKAARAAGGLHGMAVVLGMYAALRREEIASLRWDCFDDGWMTIQGKGDRVRTIPIHPVVAEMCDDLPRCGSYVFPGRFGGHVNPATIWQWVRELADEAGVGLIRPHWLRHTCLATQNDNTGDLRSVQHFAGHSRPETTSGYTRATRRRLAAVVASLDY